MWEKLFMKDIQKFIKASSVDSGKILLDFVMVQKKIDKASKIQMYSEV